ncbi:hypothetical protein T440DRAFT_528804 [Plenodomus tracheiphilus IPT5]|uniref:Uncharacterized protein n=1 Tax=Plenodomus tracheiphilus IPT5 TaxID=1408161 RepID=A0A6A7B7R8_9PLEO|nr:hypothetical protein T440DRAFT_528804 [Plenodomus tracheiphilus IPT5]
MGSEIRNISLFSTFRARNGGSDTSFVNPNNVDIPAGSDTESDSGEEAKAQEYLAKTNDEVDRPVQTAFGKGTNVWRSSDGTLHAELDEESKEKLRKQELRDNEMRLQKMLKKALQTRKKEEKGLQKNQEEEKKTDSGGVAWWKTRCAAPRQLKRTEERRLVRLAMLKDKEDEEDKRKREDVENKPPSTDGVIYPTLPSYLSTPLSPSLPANIPFPRPHLTTTSTQYSTLSSSSSAIQPVSTAAHISAPPTSLVQPTLYPSRSSHAPRHNRNSTLIGPLGAYNRPSHRIPSTSHRSVAPRRVHMDSFCENEAEVDRFGERPYLLGQNQSSLTRVTEEQLDRDAVYEQRKKRKMDEGGEEKMADLLKRKSWLRR